MIQLQKTNSGRVLLLVIGLIIVSFGIGALRLAAEAQEIGRQQQVINKIIDDQSPLIFAFDNVNSIGNRVTFEVVCDRVENGGKYKCVTRQTAPVVVEITPVPVVVVTPTPTGGP
jgi:hypothetical protein